MTRIANVVGARPQFIKAGPVSKALAAAGLEELLINTGQHYDPLLADRVMEDVGLRQPDINLGVGSGSHAQQTGAIVAQLEPILRTSQIDAVIVYGDTNTTLGAALSSVKLGLLTAHVEAGLRSFNRRMPEEVNRIVTDHICDLLFAPTETAMDHLKSEGLIDRAALTGDVMVDALQSIDFARVDLPDWARGTFYVATIHRPENTDDGARLTAIISKLDNMSAPVHLLTHPRLRQRLLELDLHPRGSLQMRDPLSYTAMLATLRQSAGIFTDSGGLQKEAFILEVPCITVRNETEWPETLVNSWNVLAPVGPALDAAAPKAPHERSPANPFGDGLAASHIVELLAGAGTSPKPVH